MGIGSSTICFNSSLSVEGSIQPFKNSVRVKAESATMITNIIKRSLLAPIDYAKTRFLISLSSEVHVISYYNY